MPNRNPRPTGPSPLAHLVDPTPPPPSLRAAVIARVLDVDTDASRRLADEIAYRRVVMYDDGGELVLPAEEEMDQWENEIRLLAAALDAARLRLDAPAAPAQPDAAAGAGAEQEADHA